MKRQRLSLCRPVQPRLAVSFRWVNNQCWTPQSLSCSSAKPCQPPQPGQGHCPPLQNGKEKGKRSSSQEENRRKVFILNCLTWRAQFSSQALHIAFIIIAARFAPALVETSVESVLSMNGGNGDIHHFPNISVSFVHESHENVVVGSSIFLYSSTVLSQYSCRVRGVCVFTHLEQAILQPWFINVHSLLLSNIQKIPWNFGVEMLYSLSTNTYLIIS